MFYLRCVQEEDHEWLVELHNDPLVLKNLTDPRAITLESHMRWWNSLSENKEVRMVFCKMTIKDSSSDTNSYKEEKLGFCKFYSIDRINSNCVLGADIHKDYRGQGYASTMWSVMLERCFDTWNLHRVSLTTAEYNKVAQHVYKKMGFYEEGRMIQSLFRDGRYHDQICMSLLKDRWKNET